MLLKRDFKLSYGVNICNINKLLFNNVLTTLIMFQKIMIYFKLTRQ